MNPVIKFTTLFGLLAVELALELTAKGDTNVKYAISGVSIVISMFFVWRSFYGMRIGGAQGAAKPAGGSHAPVKVTAVTASSDEPAA